MWWIWPSKVSRPGKSGVRAAESGPVAMMTNRARTTSPVSTRTVHVVSSSSRVAATTLALKSMPERRSRVSATQLM